AAARPMDMMSKAVPNPDACTTSASTTSAADDTVRWIVILLITSDHVVPRVASRLQCSVASSCARTPAATTSGTTVAGRSGTGGIGCSDDIGTSSDGG